MLKYLPRPILFAHLRLAQGSYIFWGIALAKCLFVSKGYVCMQATRQAACRQDEIEKELERNDAM